MIKDTNGDQILSARMALDSAAVEVFQIQIDCREGDELRGRAGGGLGLAARLAGVGSYVDLHAGTFDLSAFAGETKTFDIRLTAPAFTSFSRENVALAVGRPKAPDAPDGLNLSGGAATWFYPADADNVAGYEIRIDGVAVDVGLTFSYDLPDEFDSVELRAYNFFGYSDWT